MEAYLTLSFDAQLADRDPRSRGGAAHRDGAVRVGGRVEHAALVEPARHLLGLARRVPSHIVDEPLERVVHLQTTHTASMHREKRAQMQWREGSGLTRDT